MPRTPRQALVFLASLWLALGILVPLTTPRAAADDPQLRKLEAHLASDVNAFRESLQLIPMERRADLDAVARAHSEDMARRHYFSHVTPEGWNWVDRLRHAGITGFAMAGENVGLTDQSDPDDRILQAWEHSPPHRKNLTARPYNATGVGIARAANGTLYYTQLYLAYPR
jgi:uncharacterized protein YkwD